MGPSRIVSIVPLPAREIVSKRNPDASGAPFSSSRSPILTAAIRSNRRNVDVSISKNVGNCRGTTLNESATLSSVGRWIAPLRVAGIVLAGIDGIGGELSAFALLAGSLAGETDG